MKAVILAAGFGTRLSAIMPKPLTAIKNEKTILDLQIEKLTPHVPIDDIYIVVGYKKELVMEKFPDMAFVYNENYARTNTGKSLLKAVQKINDDILWLNGDVYFDNDILPLLLSQKQSAVLVDNKQCGDEEVKYSIDKNGFISEISKKVKNPLGESLGINIITKKDRAFFIKALKKIKGNDYFERALELIIKENKVKITPINIGDHYCQEIDFPEDLENVQKHLHNLQSK